MMRLFSLLALTLTLSPLAALASFPSGDERQEQHSWVATYAGVTELDNLNILATLEESRDGVEEPQAHQGRIQNYLPAVQRAYHLKLVVAEQPSLDVAFPLEPRTIMVNGSARQAYVSGNNAGDFDFVIVALEDGRLQATYTRHIGPVEFNKGDFILNPVPHVLRK